MNYKKWKIQILCPCLSINVSDEKSNLKKLKWVKLNIEDLQTRMYLQNIQAEETAQQNLPAFELLILQLVGSK